MCDPVSIGSALLTVAGTGMQMKAQKDAQKATERAMASNAEKQRILTDDSQVRVGNALDKFDRNNFDETQNAATEMIANKFAQATENSALPGEYSGVSVSDNTRRFADDEATKNNEYLNQYQQALAKLRGFSEGQNTNNTSMGREAEAIQLNNNFMQGNNAILPYQLEAAGNKAQSPLGDLFTAAGGVGLQYGLSAKTAAGAAGSVNKAGQYTDGLFKGSYTTPAGAQKAAAKAGIIWK